jgi:hypothetical protein
MKAVKLKIANLPFDGVQQPAGAVVKVPDARAAHLIRLGHAEAAPDDADVANPGHNPLADSIEPASPVAPKKPALVKEPKVEDKPPSSTEKK